nr:transposase [Prochlorothrix hollandica]
MITQAKKTAEREWLADVSAVPLQQSVQDLGAAFKNFFESRSGKRKGSKVGLPRLKLKTANIRKDFLHKTTTQLIHENQVVVLEDLAVKTMLGNRKLARAISEQGWGTARTMCEAKANRVNDREVRIISRWEPTS